MGRVWRGVIECTDCTFLFYFLHSVAWCLDPPGWGGVLWILLLACNSGGCLSKGVLISMCPRLSDEHKEEKAY